MTTLNKNDLVTIFQDPLTEREEEGKARLIQYKSDLGFYKGNTVEVWKVQFLSDGFFCDRRILVKNEETERSAES